MSGGHKDGGYRLCTAGDQVVQDFLRSSAYENGYSQAISDVREFLNRHSISMRWNRMYNARDINALLSFLESHGPDLLMRGPDWEIGFRRKGKGLEFYEE